MERGGLPAEIMQGMSRGTVSPLDVYHGSPYRFPPTARNPLGEFDASKIGTGEGAQVYGHGIYTAEAPAVARGYADRLGSNIISVDGKPMDFNDPVHIAASILSDPNNAGLPGKQLANAIRYDPKGIVPYGTESKVEEIAKALESGNLPKFTNQKGNFYKADLPDEKIASMLDWDKPMSEQQMIALYDKMQQTELASFAKPFQDNFYKSIERGQPATDGQDLFMELSKELGGQKYVSDYLRKIGVPGIKYLDEMSRGTRYSGDSAYFHASNSFKDSGYTFDQALEGMKQAYKTANPKELKDALDAVYAPRTQNFVVFPGEEKSMRILERNGETAASPFYQDPFPDTAR
jgi:hypothetical protein